MIEEPTRGTNTLDLIITNFPSHFIRTDVIPGILDHDVVLAEIEAKPKTNIQRPRNIALYNKAKWVSIRVDMETTTDKIKQMDYEKKYVEEMWNTLNQT
jgi:hypothetical protein